MHHEFHIETRDRIDVHDVTERVVAEIPSGVSGLCTVFIRHTTAGICVNEAEPGLLADLGDFLRQAVPVSGWAHDEIDGNADAHLRAALVGSHVTVPVANGEPVLGRWQSILLVECDGPRSRSVSVTVVPAAGDP